MCLPNALGSRVPVRSWCIRFQTLSAVRFSRILAKDADAAILNLEQGDASTDWGRLIFHVADVDACWRLLTDLGFAPEKPRNASWGERYFHISDPDGHELSFARRMP